MLTCRGTFYLNTANSVHKSNDTFQLAENNHITYIHDDDLKNLKIGKNRIRFDFSRKYDIWNIVSKAYCFTQLLEHCRNLDGFKSHSLITPIDHVFQYVTDENNLLVKDGVGNFFFTAIDEQKYFNEISSLSMGFTWSNIIIGSLIQRMNTTRINEWGLRFYDLNDPRIWKPEEKKNLRTLMLSH